MRTTSSITSILKPLEDAIRLRLLAAITGKTAVSDLDRELFTLPARLGGLNVPNPSSISATEFSASKKITKPLVDLIYHQTQQYTFDTCDQQHRLKALTRKEKRDAQSVAAERLHSQLTPTLQKSIKVTKEKGASSWLAVLPIEKHGFYLHWSAFCDTLCLSYGWQPSLYPHPVCAVTLFPFGSRLELPHGRFPNNSSQRNSWPHSQPSFRSMPWRLCGTSPEPLSGESLTYSTANREDSARLDIRACGFWGLPQQQALLMCESTTLARLPTVAFNWQLASYRRNEKVKAASVWFGKLSVAHLLH